VDLRPHAEHGDESRDSRPFASFAGQAFILASFAGSRLARSGLPAAFFRDSRHDFAGVSLTRAVNIIGVVLAAWVPPLACPTVS
jgi:hypothetical protein